VQDITDAAGVPKGSFYNHFESKEVLGAEVLEHYWKQGACVTLRQLEDQQSKPLERLRAYFETLAAKYVALDFTCGCLLGNLGSEMADHSKVIAERLASIFVGWTHAVAACIAEAQKAGEVPANIDPEILAGYLLNAWEGATIRARIDKSDAALTQFMDITFTKLLS
jgi:TetR/AcrR family transcriptional repressor of nem operon